MQLHKNINQLNDSFGDHSSIPRDIPIAILNSAEMQWMTDHPSFRESYYYWTGEVTRREWVMTGDDLRFETLQKTKKLIAENPRPQLQVSTLLKYIF